MMKNALGLIETVGLAAAVTAADAAVKAANVQLAGYELTRGGGLTTVKLWGDVGAVQAAVDAGKAAASKVNQVWAAHVIPRPHAELAGMIMSADTVGAAPAPVTADKCFPDEISAESRLTESSPSCNLCLDPACPRKKGEPRVRCIHYGKNNNKEE